MNELTKHETQERLFHESIVEETKGAFIECGESLGKIRDKKLYRSTHATFEDYCKEKWGWSDRRARQLIDAATLVADLPEDQQKEIKNEYQARKLKKAKNEKSEPKTGTTVPLLGTPKTIDAEVILCDETEESCPIPVDILDDWKRNTETFEEFLSMASKLKCAIEKGKSDDDIIFRELTGQALPYVKSLYTAIKVAIPHAVCLACGGFERKACTACKGKGYIGKLMYDKMTASELKDMRKIKADK